MRRRTPRATVRHDRSGGGLKPREQGDRGERLRAPRSLQARDGRVVARSRNTRPSALSRSRAGPEPAASPRRSHLRRAALAACVDASAERCCLRSQQRPGSVASLSASHPTRLETRTKESSARASHRASTNPAGETKVNRMRSAALRGDGAASARRTRPLRWPRRRSSAFARTRKMVNYARARRSRTKVRWRPVAILTGKSIVRLGYRGERPIEPSSSWFTPKLPSG